MKANGFILVSMVWLQPVLLPKAACSLVILVNVCEPTGTDLLPYLPTLMDKLFLAVTVRNVSL